MRESECPLTHCKERETTDAYATNARTTSERERQTTDAYALHNDARTTSVKGKYCWRPILNGFHVITNWVAPSPDHKKILCV